MDVVKELQLETLKGMMTARREDFSKGVLSVGRMGKQQSLAVLDYQSVSHLEHM